MHIRGFDFDTPRDYEQAGQTAVLDAAIILAKHFLRRDPTHEELLDMGAALYSTYINDEEEEEKHPMTGYRADVWMAGYNMLST